MSRFGLLSDDSDWMAWMDPSESLKMTARLMLLTLTLFSASRIAIISAVKMVMPSESRKLIPVPSSWRK